MNNLRKILFYLILIEFVIIDVLFLNKLKIMNKNQKILNDKIKELELDYKFLDYNTDELKEYYVK